MVTPKQALISSSVALALASVAPASASELDVLKEQVRILSQEIQALKPNDTSVSYSRRAGAAKAGDAVVAGDKNRSMVLGGTQVQIGGFIRMDGHWDLDYNRGDYATTAGLPSGAAVDAGLPNNTSFGMHARPSRFFVDLKKKAGNGTRVRGHLEFDFNGARSASNSHAPRLRHAYFDYGKLKIGQTWTNYAQFHAGVASLNFASPAGITRMRQAGVRYTFGNFAVSAEDTGPNSPTIAPTTALNEWPDLVARWEQKFGAIKAGVSGVIGQTKTTADSDVGWALKGAISWALGKGSKVIFQFNTTEGRSRYTQQTAVPRAAVGPGGITPAEVETIAIGWAQKLGAGAINLYYGQNDYKNAAALGSARDRDSTMYINYIWSPAQAISFGVQLQRDMRDDAANSRVDSDRIMFTGMYNFTK